MCMRIVLSKLENIFTQPKQKDIAEDISEDKYEDELSDPYLELSTLDESKNIEMIKLCISMIKFNYVDNKT